MNAYKTYVQIDASGRLVLESLPFHPGAWVEVLLLDQTRQPAERMESWKALMRHVQSLPHSQSLTEADIAAEVAAVRDGQ